MESTNYCVAILTRNRKDLLAAVLEKVATWPGVVKTIVIDNASTDGTFEYIQRNYPHVVLKRTANNLGATGGRNYALTCAHELGCDFVFLAEDDTIPSLDALIGTMELLQADDKTLMVGTSGGILKNGTPKWGSYRTVKTIASANVYYADFIHFDNCAIRTSEFLNIGGLRDDYFIMFEEPEFGYRAQKHNWEILVLTNPLERMNLGAASSAANEYPWRSYYQTRNFLRFAISAKSPTLIFGFILRTTKQLVLGFSKRSWKDLNFRFRGVRDALTGKMGMQVSPEPPQSGA